MPTIKVPSRKNSQPYWPNELRDAGYVGELKILEGFCVLIIPKPDATNRDIAKTLELMAQDFKFRAQKDERNETKAQE